MHLVSIEKINLYKLLPISSYSTVCRCALDLVFEVDDRESIEILAQHLILFLLSAHVALLLLKTFYSSAV